MAIPFPSGFAAAPTALNAASFGARVGAGRVLLQRAFQRRVAVNPCAVRGPKRGVRDTPRDIVATVLAMQ